MSRLILIVAVIVAVCISSVYAAVDADLITSLPGFGKTPTAQYSGLIGVDKGNTAYLHYWLVTSAASNPSSAPLTIWLNGGPGCSSLDGFMYENGPFKFTGNITDGVPQLRENPYSWHMAANMLYIESPFGVGFSYAVNGSLSNSDDTTSQNLYGFLLNFLNLYPEYAKNDVYITGESYAGIYVPTFALRVLEGNAAGNMKVNLVGFAVGNGCVGEGGSCGDDVGDYIQVEFFYGHAMISQPAYNDIIAKCGQYINGSSNACQNALSDAYDAVGNIWVYDVYDTCGNENVVAHKATKPRVNNNPYLNKIEDPIQCQELDSSLGDTYLNNAQVKQALHVDKVPMQSPWSVCANIDYEETVSSLLPTYPKLISELRVLIFSGDADACVPWVGSEMWTRQLGYPVKQEWHPYTVSAGGDQWTAGFATNYDTPHGFYFWTIKHAGHMVPQYEPETALYFFQNFIAGTPL